MFYGKGAGKLPTASAVIADVVHIAKSPNTSQSLTWEDSNATQWKIFLCMKMLFITDYVVSYRKKNRLPFWRGILLIPARSAR